jgi:Tfp pilus assembly protein PilF
MTRRRQTGRKAPPLSKQRSKPRRWLQLFPILSVAIAATTLIYVASRNRANDELEAVKLANEAQDLLIGPGERYGAMGPDLPTRERRAQLEMAKDKLDEALRRDPKSSDAWKHLGDYYLELRNLPRAKYSFEKALAIDPEGEGGMLGLAVTFEFLNDTENAERYIRKAIATEPAYAEAYVELGLLLEEQHRLAEAIRQFEKAIRLDPLNYVAWGNLGVAQDRMGDPESAKESIERAISIETKYPQPYHSLGIVNLRLGRQDEAIAAFRHAVQIQPNRALYYRSLGKAFLPKDTKLALACLEMAESLEPGDQETATLLSQLRPTGSLPGSATNPDLSQYLEEALGQLR